MRSPILYVYIKVYVKKVNILHTHIHVCTCVCACRMDNSAPDKSIAAGSVVLDTHYQPQVPDDDHAYCNVDDVQQQMSALTSNSACNKNIEHGQQPMQNDDHAFSNTELTQEQVSATCGSQTYGAAPIDAASSK